MITPEQRKVIGELLRNVPLSVVVEAVHNLGVRPEDMFTEFELAGWARDNGYIDRG